MSGEIAKAVPEGARVSITPDAEIIKLGTESIKALREEDPERRFNILT